MWIWRLGDWETERRDLETKEKTRLGDGWRKRLGDPKTEIRRLSLDDKSLSLNPSPS